ncbi:TIGR01244 family sulfur transferase [Martelella sp. HB161492]|uniref:TIGR01244 family sulfur transferase n=1 Tax=Martelella sp. HB161492 TaxID=2720726 RepID=UPI001591E73B|nr:TIGR01244 family sulfur transferase [Martelella sp. HB161492]
MHARPVTHNYHVTGQLKPADMAEVAKAGYEAVICMRPDGEGFFQPKFADVETAAKSQGLKVFYLPVGGTSSPITQAPKLKAILKEVQGPVLAYCASGGRCASLYQLAQQAG